jgi:hypothetical protein
MEPELERDDDPSGSRRISDWLAALPQGAEIAWSDDAFLGEGFRHMLSGWVDVHVPLAEDELSLNWIWTVDLVEQEGERDDEGCDAWILAEGYALVVRRDERVLAALACYQDGSLAELSDDEAVYVSPDDRSLSWPLLEQEGLAVWLTPLCRLESVSRALEGVAARAGRPDLSFRFEPDMRTSPMVAAAQESAAEVREALEEGDTSRFEVMRFDDPGWMADFLGVSLEEAEEEVRDHKERVAVLIAEHDQLVAARQERARALLARQDVRARLGLGD